jgi:manganese/zinc/iron transport system permease protein
MGTILLADIAFIALFYKELKLATFDASLAAALGFSPALLHYGLMALVSVTAVGAFDAVGSILVVALMITPPATAYLITNSLRSMLTLSALIGVTSAISGYWLARWLDANIAGSMATMTGIIFLLTFLLAPERGVVALAQRRVRQRWEFAQAALAIHLLHHEGAPEAAEENRIDHLSDHLRWNREFARQVVQRAQRQGLIARQNGSLLLTDKGRQVAHEAIIR